MGVTWLIALGGGGGYRPWVLGTLINEGVRLRKRGRIDLFQFFFCLYTTQIIVLKVALFFYLLLFNSLAKTTVLR
jgi:hypothetical protein